MSEGFRSEVRKALGHYVYRLVDPRNGETFYVGKGKDNRVFDHVNGKPPPDDDEVSAKIERIHQIRNAGLSVLHVIHRHGLEESVALEVEGALIDVYPGLTNVVGGQGNGDRGCAHPAELITRYGAGEIDTFLHPVMEVLVGKTIRQADIYNAARFAWRVDIDRARQAEYILAVSNGLVRAVFKPEEWLKATPKNFSEFLEEGDNSLSHRWGFRGQPASSDVQALYLNKRIRKRKPGEASPVRYFL